MSARADATAQADAAVPDGPPVVRYAVREALGLLTMAAALFASAGSLRWWQAWATLAVMLAWTLATAFVVTRVHPGLLAERLGPRQGAKAWDVAIMSVVGLAQLARYIVAGLDRRHGWTAAWWVGTFGAAPRAPLFPLQLLALALCALGYALVVWATAANAYFSQIVRIQTERGHTVASRGPYGFVRHPAYLGAILFELAAPILLGSLPALAISALTVGLLVFRTALEDRTLRAELPGYEAYARRVRRRLVPGVW